MDQSSGIRILFSGQYWPGANTVYISRAFERCGAIVRILNETGLLPDWRQPKSKIARRLLRKPVIEAEWNRQMLDLVTGFKPDLVYVTNADLCWPSTVKAIQEASIPVMCFYHDVQWKNRAGTRFEENLLYFDLIASTRHWHSQEFRAAGARAVSIVRFGCEPTVHRPVQIDCRTMEQYGCDITFVATCEARRSAELEELVGSGFPYRFRLWGGLWNKLPPDRHVLKYWEGREVHESEIPIIYAASKVALHWVGWEPKSPDPALRKGDQHNSRTFQIASCGGAMMMAQRTPEHCRFFVEDEEAVFFDDVGELREKLKYWLDPARDERRRRVAAAGRVRCLADDYSYVPVVRSFLEFFGLADTVVAKSQIGVAS